MAGRPDRQGSLVAGALLAPLVYVLSLGPVARLFYTVIPDRDRAKHLLSIVYAPLWLAIQYGPDFIGNGLERYARFWLGK